MISQMANWVTTGMLLISMLSVAVSDDPFIAKGRNGAVASDDERCSKIGIEVMEIGGHAVDAMVAVTFCEGVVRPATSGIGGGGFMIIKPHDDEALVIDMREFAPGSASENMYDGNFAMKHYGIHSIAVPAQLKGLYAAWKLYGRIPWRFLVLPSEMLARYGFIISKNLNEMIELASKPSPPYMPANYIMNDRGLKKIFTRNGTLLKEGDICKNIELADTLRQIGIHGPDVFYKGEIGRNLVSDIKRNGGNITMKDLNLYDVIFRRPVTTEVLGLKLLGVPPPASGAASMFLMLNILDQYGFPLFTPSEYEITKIHRRIEAQKHAFAVRMNLGDPAFVDVGEVLHNMLSPEFATELKKTIYDNMTFPPMHYGGKWKLWNQSNQDGTTHFCVVDKDRNAVSVTTTINFYFGSGFMSEKTGIILNNHMDDFAIPVDCMGSNCLPPTPANFIRPYKRPMSSAAPTVIMQGDHFRGVIGASGGPRIIGATTEVFLNYFVDKLGPYGSIKKARYYNTLNPDEVSYENLTALRRNIFEGLKAKGHNLKDLEGEPGICQFIVQEFEFDGGVAKLSESLIAISDPRYGGVAAAY